MINEDHCVYIKSSKEMFVILSLYMYDILLARNGKEFLNFIKEWLFSKFDLKDMEEVNYILGIKIHRDLSRKLLISIVTKDIYKKNT